MKNTKKLTLLHSNDLHGDFFAENADEMLVGGVSMLSGYINKVREEEDNVLYCIAGDMFRGSIIDSEYQGLSTIEVMNMLAPDVVTLGNHETDYGVAHLLFIEKCAKFPIVNANLHVKTNGARLFNPYKVIEMDGMKILFIGILTEEVIAQTKSDGLVGSIVDIEDAAKEITKICNAHNAIDIDFTVLLTHIGYEEDRKLAQMLDPALGVDVIIGGHSHTLPEKAITENGIVIVQAGTGTDQIGRFDVVIDTDENCVDSFEWKTVAITPENCPVDHDIEGLLTGFKNKTDEKYNRVITRFAWEMTHPDRKRETELGDLYADAMRRSLGLDIFLFGSGSIRTLKLGPIVTLGGLKENIPYAGAVYMLKVTGKQFKDMIKYMVRDEVWQGAHCEFYQLSEGLNVTYSKSTHEFEKFDFNGEPIDEDKLYTLGLQKFHYLNFNDSFGLDLEKIEAENGKRRVIATSDYEVIEEYLSEQQNIGYEVSGRLIVKE